MKYLRFTVWAIAVAIASIGQLLGAGFWLVVICLCVIAGLLATTPANAIKLPRWVSEVMIFAASILLSSMRNHLHPVVRMLSALAVLILLRVFRQSPWWVVLIAWFPDH